MDAGRARGCIGYQPVRRARCVFELEYSVIAQRAFRLRILSREERNASRRALIGPSAGTSTAPTPLAPDTAVPSPGQKPPRIALKGVSLQVDCGSLCAVIGRVGSGKSTLIQVRQGHVLDLLAGRPSSTLLWQAILGELSPLRGSVNVTGSVAFVPQVPWVLSGTLRDNITFGLPFDAEKYARVSIDSTWTCNVSRDSHAFLLSAGDCGVLP